MIPGTYDLRLYRGDTFGPITVRLFSDEAGTVPENLTGATAKSQIRDRPGGTTVVDMVAAIVTPASGVIQVGLPAATTDWSAVPLSGAWDLQVTYADGTVRTPVAGKVTVIADVTDSTALSAAAAAERSPLRDLRTA